MKTHPISSDARYTVDHEYCGHKQPRFVARFCGDWVGENISYPGAVLIATGHRLQRQGALIVTEKINENKTNKQSINRH